MRTPHPNRFDKAQDTLPAQGGKASWILVGTAILAEALLVGAWAMTRGVNADEGFYLAAGREVAEGARIYADFFFPQMPYLPWLEGAIFRILEPSLLAGRALSVGAAALSAGLVAALAWRCQRHVAASLLAVFLYVASALLLTSFSVVKTAAVSNLCLLSAFGALASGAARRPAWAFAAGIAMGTAVGFRAPVAPLGLVLGVMAWRLGRDPLIAYLGGAVVASLPWLIVAVRHAELFWFGNFGFHALRREITDWPAILDQKLAVAAKWLFLPQHAVLWGLAAWGLWRQPRWSAWPLASAVVLAATYAAATPTYLEYMTQFLPFLVLAALPALPAVVERRWLAAGVVAIYLLGMQPLLEKPLAGGAMAAERDMWSLRTVSEVTHIVRDRTGPGDRVLSWWEGYPVLGRRPGFRGVGFWESNAARKLDPETAHRYGLMRREDVESAVEQREPAVIVVPDGTWQTLRGRIDAGYLLLARVGSIDIYGRRPPAE